MRDPILTDDIVKRIRTKIKELSEEIEAARLKGQTEEVIEKEEDLENIQSYLNKNSYRGNKAVYANSADRSRKSVTIAIKRAISAIAKFNRGLARHLHNSIHTGTNCYYLPETEISWKL